MAFASKHRGTCQPVPLATSFRRWRVAARWRAATILLMALPLAAKVDAAPTAGQWTGTTGQGNAFSFVVNPDG